MQDVTVLPMTSLRHLYIFVASYCAYSKINK